MIKIRKGVFETNSSSTHSITMCSDEQYKQWKDGSLYYARWSDKFVTKEEVETKYKEGHSDEGFSFEEFIEDEGYYTFDDYFEHIENDYETFHAEYVTASGEKVIAFGYYGYDY